MASQMFTKYQSLVLPAFHCSDDPMFDSIMDYIIIQAKAPIASTINHQAHPALVEDLTLVFIRVGII